MKLIGSLASPYVRKVRVVLAEKKLDCTACLGLSKGIGDWPEELRSPVWATAAGLAMYSAKLKLHRPPPRRNRGLMGLVMR